jgi:DNA-binding PucR family transcriptional regulator
MCLLSDERGHGHLAPEVESVAEVLGADALIAAVPEGVLVVHPLGDASAGDPIAAARASAADVLAALAEGSRCVAGLSSVFSGVTGFVGAYREVRQVSKCLQTFGSDRAGSVLAAPELGAGSLFLAATNREEADEFVRQTLGPLLDPGDRSMRDLLTTLAVFLAKSRNVRETADRLQVHENTIRYRLARIAELSGLDVATDTDDQLAGQLATLILRLEGVLSLPALAAA